MLDSLHNRSFILLTLLMFFSISAYCQQFAENTKNCDNYLQIKGESNVNRFTFSYNTSFLKHRIVDKQNPEQDEIEISIPVKEFVPSNPMMYEDFLSMMKESRHPRILISFSRKELLNISPSDNESCPTVRITIAGISRNYEIDCHIDECFGNLYLRGKDELSLTDFGLRPPEKLLGMVKVNNKIDVNFGFIITFTDTNQLSSKF